MSLRESLAGAAQRAFNGLARGTLIKADDRHKWQEVRVRTEYGDDWSNVEVAHQYGFTSVAKPPADDKTSEASEVIIAFPDGTRSHPIVIVCGDRRYRLQGLQEGEVALHDDQGQKVHISRDGTIVDGGRNKKWIKATTGNATLKVMDGEIYSKVGSLAIYLRPGRIDLGMKNAPHAIVTVDGPSTKVFAAISEDDGGTLD